ncbi:hypothetical protein N510_002572 [Firmicutes bacterium ASF500]|nr:hypothetical protein N510_002572 [Firmicutes bacterium ASF500]
MILTPMRYKGYTWPHNPRVYSIDYRRTMAVNQAPFSGYQLQDLGLAHRVMEGEGEFTGAGAYAEFQRLACVFYEKGPGLLIHPLWQAANTYFVALRLEQAPRPDYVRYSFAFWEESGQYSGVTVRTAEGKTGQSQGGAENVPETEQGVWQEGKVQNAVWQDGNRIVPVKVPFQGPAVNQGTEQPAYHRVVKEDTLWGLARRYGLSLTELIALNPQIKNPNLIYTGQEVRVR